MGSLRVLVLTVLALLAFAGNSLLCRATLRGLSIDAASFTALRLVSGAVVLWIILQVRGGDFRKHGSWGSATALFVYAAAFSFAYLSLSAGTGALLLFGAVQATMILWGLGRGERLHARQFIGLALAFGGLVFLLFPGISAPPIGSSLLMLGAGVGWGVYSLRGKGVADPVAATAGNFGRAAPMALLLGLVFVSSAKLDRVGVAYAVASGAITSGLGYVIWYAALPGLKAVAAATVQLSVPVITAAAGILLLGESLTLRFAIAAAAVLGGIALVVLEKRRVVA